MSFSKWLQSKSILLASSSIQMAQIRSISKNFELLIYLTKCNAWQYCHPRLNILNYFMSNRYEHMFLFCFIFYWFIKLKRRDIAILPFPSKCRCKVFLFPKNMIVQIETLGLRLIIMKFFVLFLGFRARKIFWLRKLKHRVAWDFF